jgi:hypothetical protein
MRKQRPEGIVGLIIAKESIVVQSNKNGFHVFIFCE